MDREGFRHWRKDYLGLTQAEAAERLGVSIRQVKHYEAGTRAIPDRTAQRCRDIGLRRRMFAKRSEYDPRRDQAETPSDFFKRIDKTFRFTLDAAALPTTAKVKKFFSPYDDALSKPWTGCVWLNPPYYSANLEKWIRHAFEQAQAGATVVVLVPNRTDTNWWRDYALRAAEIWFIRGRLARFNRSVLLVFRKVRKNSRPELKSIDAWSSGRPTGN